MQINQLGNDVSLCPRMPGFSGGHLIGESNSLSFSDYVAVLIHFTWMFNGEP